MTAKLNTGRVLRITLGGAPEKRELLRRILAGSGSVTLAAIDSEGVLTAFLEDWEAELDLASSLFASGMYPLNTLDLGIPAEGTHHAS